MRNLLTAVVLLFFLFPYFIYSQHNNSELPTSINEDGAPPDQSSILDLQSADKGLLIPRMPFCDIEAIQNPMEGLMVFDTEYKCLRIYIQDVWQCLYNTGRALGKDFAFTGWSNPTIDEGWDTDLDIDSQENVYVTSSTEDGEGRLIKFDSKGTEKWSIFEFPGTLMYQVEVDQNDFVYSIGSSGSSNPTFNGTTIPNPGIFLSKTSPDGSSSEVISLVDRGLVLKIDTDGNLVIASISPVNNSDNAELIITKFTNSMIPIWVQKIDLISTKFWGYVNNDINIDFDDQNDIYITGYHDTGLLDPLLNIEPVDEYNIFVAKFESQTGDNMWYRNIASDVPLNADAMYVANDVVEVFGSTGVNNSGYGDHFYIKRFNSDTGTDRNSSNFDYSWRVAGSAINKAKDEIVFTISDYTNGTSEYKTLFYAPFSYANNAHTFTDSKSISFYGGPMSYNAAGDRIYGAGWGTQAGNTTITGNNNGNTIVFKIQKD